MNIDRTLRYLAALLTVVEAHHIDGQAYAALIASYPGELPKFAHDLASLITAHPEVSFPTDKIVGALRGRVERLVRRDTISGFGDTKTQSPNPDMIVEPPTIVELPTNGKPSKPMHVRTSRCPRKVKHRGSSRLPHRKS